MGTISISETPLVTLTGTCEWLWTTSQWKIEPDTVPPPSSRPGSTIPERVTLTYSLLALQGPLGSDKAPSALTHQTAAYALKQQVTHRVVLFIGVVFVIGGGAL